MTGDGGRASGGKGTEKSLAGRDITLTLSTFCCPPYPLTDTHKFDEFFFFWCPDAIAELIASTFRPLVSTGNHVRYILQVTRGGRKFEILVIELATSWRIEIHSLRYSDPMVKAYGGLASSYPKKLCPFRYVSWMDYRWSEGAYLVASVTRPTGSILGCMKGWGKAIAILISADAENIAKGRKVATLKDAEYGRVLTDRVRRLCTGPPTAAEWRMTQLLFKFERATHRVVTVDAPQSMNRKSSINKYLFLHCYCCSSFLATWSYVFVWHSVSV